MRKADLWTAGFLILFSVSCIIKSLELPITWIPNRGPGAGMVPFYLSIVLLGMSVLLLVRTLLRLSPEGRSEKNFIAHQAVRMVTVVVLSVTGLITISQFGGMYLGMLLFLMFYLRYLGNHSWRFTLTLALSTPVVVFVFFEKLMLILLPKGFTEPFFMLLY